MKQRITIAHKLMVAMLLVGTSLSVYTLFHLTSDLERASVGINLNDLNDASLVFHKAYWIIGLTLLVGLALSIQFLYYIKVKPTNDSVPSTENRTTNIKSSDGSYDTKNQKEEIAKAVKEIQLIAAGVKNPKLKYQKLLSALCMKLEASQGLIYEVKKVKNKKFLELIASFSYKMPDDGTITFDFDEGLVGQVAKTGNKMNIDNIPEGYIEISSGLGAAVPSNLTIIPISDAKKVCYVVEIASFKKISSYDEKLISESLVPEKDQNNNIFAANKIKKRSSNTKSIRVSD